MSYSKKDLERVRPLQVFHFGGGCALLKSVKTRIAANRNAKSD